MIEFILFDIKLINALLSLENKAHGSRFNIKGDILLSDPSALVISLELDPGVSRQIF